MGKIVSSTFVSLDGVVNHLDRWHFDFIDDESGEFAQRQLDEHGALLMGRNTYQAYAGAWPDRDGAMADRINAMPKYVASTTLDAPEWANTTVLTGDLVEAVAELKSDPALDILMHGYGPVAKTLLANGLLDELFLWVHPMLAGIGGPDDLVLAQGLNTRLELLDVVRLGSGIVILRYAARQPR